jgi:hypothetical protein
MAKDHLKHTFWCMVLLVIRANLKCIKLYLIDVYDCKKCVYIMIRKDTKYIEKKENKLPTYYLHWEKLAQNNQ